jgi:hypothetical protein
MGLVIHVETEEPVERDESTTQQEETPDVTQELLGSQQLPINFKNLGVPIQILEKSSFSLCFYFVLLGLKKMTC